MDDQPQSVGVSTLTCVECGRSGGKRGTRWRVYLTEDDLPEAVVYCEDCAEREFGQ